MTIIIGPKIITNTIFINTLRTIDLFQFIFKLSLILLEYQSIVLKVFMKFAAAEHAASRTFIRQKIYDDGSYQKDISFDQFV